MTEGNSVTQTVSDDRYRVVLLDGGGQCAGWLSHRGQLVNAAWEAGDWEWAEARYRARVAKRRLNVPAWCEWHPVPALFEVPA